MLQGYGLTESSPVIAAEDDKYQRLGSIGKAFPSLDVKIHEQNEEGIGELLVKGPSIMIGYYNNDEATKETLDEEGWLHTGDLAKIDKDGYIIPRGRNRRLIRKEAFKISPDTIEEVISSIPFVQDCVVVGVDDEKSLSVPMAFIVLKDETLSFDEVKDQIKEKCVEELPDYEVPTYFEQIEKVPYTPNDKQDFRALEELGNSIVRNKAAKKLVKKK